MTGQPKILWADDEIDLLKPHILFLNAKGYDVDTAVSGVDALAMAAATPYDLVILDENMPGISGLETLSRLKEALPHTPVVMITKSEEENIMDQAIGSKIADYLIKPVNPNQILLSIKKTLHSSRLVAERSLSAYRDDFALIASMTDSASTPADWAELYRKLTRWQLELEAPGAAPDMAEILAAQVNEANARFGRTVSADYPHWIADTTDAPLMPHRVMKSRVLPALASGDKAWLIVIDNFRLDQWLAVAPTLGADWAIDTELMCTLLPTTTQYCRNALFSGLLPADIAAAFPALWVDEDSAEGKNLNEAPLIDSFFKRMRAPHTFSYTKVNDNDDCTRLIANVNSLRGNDLNVVVVNFIDMLSHARTENKALRELADTDAAYRSITLSWFAHSPLPDLLRAIAAKERPTVFITTDHGAVRVANPVKIGADKTVNSNLRYKVGRNLNILSGKALQITDTASFGLPPAGVSGSYLFARGRDFFAYPNNFSAAVRHYEGTLQHGGISLPEMLVPFARLTPR